MAADEDRYMYCQHIQIRILDLTKPQSEVVLFAVQTSSLEIFGGGKLVRSPLSGFVQCSSLHFTLLSWRKSWT